MPAPFEIDREEDGSATASNGRVGLRLLDGGGRVFRRRAATFGVAETTEWIVAELDGVRVYFDGTTVMVTRQDIYP
jgi:hypothetical protein